MLTSKLEQDNFGIVPFVNECLRRDLKISDNTVLDRNLGDRRGTGESAVCELNGLNPLRHKRGGRQPCPLMVQDPFSMRILDVFGK
jgi:hypothetical protein